MVENKVEIGQLELFSSHLEDVSSLIQKASWSTEMLLQKLKRPLGWETKRLQDHKSSLYLPTLKKNKNKKNWQLKHWYYWWIILFYIIHFYPLIQINCAIIPQLCNWKETVKLTTMQTIMAVVCQVCAGLTRTDKFNNTRKTTITIEQRKSSTKVDAGPTSPVLL